MRASHCSLLLLALPLLGSRAATTQLYHIKVKITASVPGTEITLRVVGVDRPTFTERPQRTPFELYLRAEQFEIRAVPANRAADLTLEVERRLTEVVVESGSATGAEVSAASGAGGLTVRGAPRRF